MGGYETITKGIRVVLGVRDAKPITPVEGAVVRRIVMRNNSIAVVLLRFRDRVETWSLEDAGDEWRPAYRLKSFVVPA